MPRSDPGDGWFRAGPVEVTTTVIVTGLGLVSMFLWVISKELFVLPFVLRGRGISGAGLEYGGVRTGQVWRLATWPFVNEPTIWLIVSLAMLWLIGGMVERQIGKARYLWLLAILVVVPALVGTIYPVRLAYGLSYVVGGLFVLLVLMQPNAQTFFGIPLWIMVAVFESITVLQLVDAREWPELVFFLSSLAVAALATRSFGLTEFHQIPHIPLPNFIAQDPYRRANRARHKQQRNRARSGDNVVPMTPAGRPVDRMRQADIDALLDKISASGIDSLSAEERRRLDEHSRHLRGE